MEGLIKQANEVTLESHKPIAYFDRAIFINWSCSLADCTYCYLSTQPKAQRDLKRSNASILAETLICKHLGWNVAYITGGIGVHTLPEQKELVRQMRAILHKPVMINLGPMTKPMLDYLQPDIEGVGVAVESFIPEIQSKVCPSKPLPAFIKTLEIANQSGLKNIITIILGLGEKKEDFPILEKFIKDNKVQKVQFCLLKPQKGTIHEHDAEPTPEYGAWWIAKTRIAFPKLKIKIALTQESLKSLSLFLKAGANSFSRYAVLKKFGSKDCEVMEEQVKIAERSFAGSLTKLPDIDWEAEVEKLELKSELKSQIKEKLNEYLKIMRRNTSKIAVLQ